MQEGGCVTTPSKTPHPTPVLPEARPVGTVRDRWSWAEPSVWTDRMLTALESGVKGGKWFSLIDKVYALPNLGLAFQRVKANRGAAGVDHVTVEQFESKLERELLRLHESLRAGTYRPQAIRRQWIPKPGSTDPRPLGIPTVRDRVVQTALRNVLEPIFERDFAEHSYGFRPGRGCKDALRRVDGLLKQGLVYVVDADLKGYFDSIPTHRLMDHVRAQVADGPVLALLEAFLAQPILDGLTSWQPDSGTPQGAVISPLLSNIYLDPLDHHMAGHGFAMTRYADDFVIQCRTLAEAEQALALVQAWVEELGLTLHPDKTRIVNATERGGFDFLGYHFERGHRWPRDKSLGKLRDALRGQTRRANGHSFYQILTNVNRTLRGWYEYFKHSDAFALQGVDGWVRMRLRSILRKRLGLTGRGRGRDHQRWPNAFFAERGLLSLCAAYASEFRPSSRR